MTERTRNKIELMDWDKCYFLRQKRKIVTKIYWNYLFSLCISPWCNYSPPISWYPANNPANNRSTHWQASNSNISHQPSNESQPSHQEATNLWLAPHSFMAFFVMSYIMESPLAWFMPAVPAPPHLLLPLWKGSVSFPLTALDCNWVCSHHAATTKILVC